MEASDVPADRERFLAIVKRASRLARERYDAQLVVMLWDLPAQPDDDAAWIETQLRASAIPVLRLSSVFPHVDAALLSSPQWSIQGDGHPTAYTYRQLAPVLMRFLRDNGVDLAPAGN
jgi:hypothetical protein